MPTTSRPPATEEPCSPTSSAPAPARASPSRGPAGDHDDEDAAEPAAHLVRCGRLQDRRAEDRRHHVRQPRGGQAEHGQPQHVGQPEQRDRRPPHDDRDEHRDAVPVHPAEPAGEQRTEQRADRERGVEDPGGLLPAAVDVLRESGEQRAGHREHHRHEVDHEGHQQHLPAAQEGQPLQDARRPGPPPAALRRHRGQPRHREQRRAERHGVQRVRRAVAVPGDQHAGQQRADRHREVELHLLERVRRRQQLLAQQPRHEGLPRR